MIELEATKGRKVTIPKRVKRYSVAYYTKAEGWVNMGIFFTTPESALENFLTYKHPIVVSDRYKPLAYTVYELLLEIPFIDEKF